MYSKYGIQNEGTTTYRIYGHTYDICIPYISRLVTWMKYVTTPTTGNLPFDVSEFARTCTKIASSASDLSRIRSGYKLSCHFSYPKDSPMKFLATLLLVSSQASAFTVVPGGCAIHETRLFAGDYVPLEGEAKINLKVDLDSPKVATMDTIEKGKKVYCRCWLSGTFPLCDGT